jgi:hypothetical protein
MTSYQFILAIVLGLYVGFAPLSLSLFIYPGNLLLFCFPFLLRAIFRFIRNLDLCRRFRAFHFHFCVSRNFGTKSERRMEPIDNRDFVFSGAALKGLGALGLTLGRSANQKPLFQEEIEGFLGGYRIQKLSSRLLLGAIARHDNPHSAFGAAYASTRGNFCRTPGELSQRIQFSNNLAGNWKEPRPLIFRIIELRSKAIKTRRNSLFHSHGDN